MITGIVLGGGVAAAVSGWQQFKASTITHEASYHITHELVQTNYAETTSFKRPLIHIDVLPFNGFRTWLNTCTSIKNVPLKKVPISDLSPDGTTIDTVTNQAVVDYDASNGRKTSGQIKRLVQKGRISLKWTLICAGIGAAIGWFIEKSIRKTDPNESNAPSAPNTPR